MKIAIGSDHAGFHLKETLREWLESNGYEVNDCGTYSDERSDYPVYGEAVADLVAAGKAQFGVLVCGSGQGICMSANKVHGIRAGIIRDDTDAVMTRSHNDANIACFGERITEPAVATSALKVFLETAFEGGRHADRIALMSKIEDGERLY